mgnify:CR=1 FL=1|jgi:hypothetical protein
MTTIKIKLSAGYYRPENDDDIPLFMHFTGGSCGIIPERLEESKTIARIHNYELSDEPAPKILIERNIKS